VYAPKALTLRRTQVVFSTILTVGLLLYCVVGSYYALRTIQKRYYPQRASHEHTPRATRLMPHGFDRSMGVT
jgi:hypothetical protein